MSATGPIALATPATPCAGSDIPHRGSATTFCAGDVWKVPGLPKLDTPKGQVPSKEAYGLSGIFIGLVFCHSAPNTILAPPLPKPAIKDSSSIPSDASKS